MNRLTRVERLVLADCVAFIVVALLWLFLLWWAGREVTWLLEHGFDSAARWIGVGGIAVFCLGAIGLVSLAAWILRHEYEDD